MKHSLFRPLLIGIIVAAICFGLDVVFNNVDTVVEHLIRIVVLVVAIWLVLKLTDPKS